MAEPRLSEGLGRSAKPASAGILLVDDNPANLLVLRAILEHYEPDLVEARSGAEALRKLAAQDFAVILLDVQMPGMNGFETAQRIRTMTSDRVPIIFITAYDSDEFPVEQAYSLGAVDYLVKPLVPVIVRAKVDSFVELYGEKVRARLEAEQLRLLVESARDYAIFHLDPQGFVASWNLGAERIMQYSAGEILGKHISQFYTREAIDQDWPATELRMAERLGRFEDEGWRVRRDGSTYWANVVITPLRDEAGLLRGFSKITRDMTERKRAEEGARRLLEEATARRVAEENSRLLEAERERLRESEQRFSRFMQHLPGLAWIKDLEGRYAYANEAAARAFGLTRDQLYGKRDDEIFPTETAVRFMDNDRQALTSECGVQLVESLVHHDGVQHHSLVSKFPILGATGEPAYVGGMAIDITDRQRAEQELRHNEERLELAQNAGRIGTFEWHIQSDRVEWSDVEEEIFGLATGTFDGTLDHWKRTLHPADRDRVVRECLQAVATGSDLHTEFRILRPDGETRWILGKGRVYCDELGVPLRMVGVNVDITDRKQSEEALREADRRKDEFLATLAHELRNPLAPIRNSLQILKLPHIEPEVAAQAREMMERQLHHMVRLVDDLLDVSRVMRGKIELRKELIELSAIVARAVETVQPLIDAQNHELIIDVPQESLLVSADPIRLAQVIGNIVTNAAKYTDAGGQIRIAATHVEDMVELRVKDNGIGIAPPMLSQIFDLFVQADQASVRSQGGLGIGLTLVRNLVELHGGEVAAHSDGIGTGTEIVVRLPMHRLPKRLANDETPHTNTVAQDIAGRRLLVVDDNRDAATSLAMLLRLQGCEVQIANDGPTAIEAAMKHRPELIFLDIGMPGMDGYEVARRIRHLPGLGDITLAALTGWGQQEDRRRSAEAGFDHHLVKPVQPSMLETVLAGIGPRRT